MEAISHIKELLEFPKPDSAVELSQSETETDIVTRSLWTTDYHNVCLPAV